MTLTVDATDDVGVVRVNFYLDDRLLLSDTTPFREEADGIFTEEEKPYMVPAGFSWLDLYAMGLARPEEVPDTFLLTDIEALGMGRLAARKVPVTLEQIVTALGSRSPSASEAQSEFTLSIYLLHRGKTPDAAAVQRADAIARALAAFFDAATGSRMRLVPAHGGQ